MVVFGSIYHETVSFEVTPLVRILVDKVLEDCLPTEEKQMSKLLIDDSICLGWYGWLSTSNRKPNTRKMFSAGEECFSFSQRMRPAGAGSVTVKAPHLSDCHCSLNFQKKICSLVVHIFVEFG